jgi:hypothetical protein
MIETKYGVIRPLKDNTFKGYVNFGKDYFSVNELEIFNHYFDLGFSIIDSRYVLQGGSTQNYYYKYKNEFGEDVQEHVQEVTHPNMIMITELAKAD